MPLPAGCDGFWRSWSKPEGFCLFLEHTGGVRKRHACFLPPPPGRSMTSSMRSSAWSPATMSCSASGPPTAPRCPARYGGAAPLRLKGVGLVASHAPSPFTLACVGVALKYGRGLKCGRGLRCGRGPSGSLTTPPDRCPPPRPSWRSSPPPQRAAAPVLLSCPASRLRPQVFGGGSYGAGGGEVSWRGWKGLMGRGGAVL